MNANTVAALLARARAMGVDRLDAQLLIARQLGRSRAWLIAHDDTALDAPQCQSVVADLARRAAGTPLAYITGEREFHGLVLRVTPEVLVPRPETETLVDWAIELLGGALGSVDSPRVLDLGAGSGAIALAVKRACPHVRMHATDASAAALDVARQNAAALGLELRFSVSDWWQAVDAEALDLVLSNPPYIAEGDPHLKALVHEPREALTPGGDGLGAIERIVAGAAQHMAPGAWLLLEHGHDQGAAVRHRLGRAGFTRVETRRDLAGLERCTGASMGSPETASLA